VPANVPVVTFAPASRAGLIAGKKVFVVATPDSDDHFTGLRILVEKDGVVPTIGYAECGLIRCHEFGA
jgi:hypothetical protein